ESATVASGPPLWTASSAYEIEGRAPVDGAKLAFTAVGPDYLKTLGIRLLRGREIGAQDVASAAPVALINRKLAATFPVGEDPLGRRIRLAELGQKRFGSQASFEGSPWCTVVGVVDDVKNNGLREDVQPAVYVPFTLAPHATPWGLDLVVKTAGNPMVL